MGFGCREADAGKGPVVSTAVAGVAGQEEWMVDAILAPESDTVSVVFEYFREAGS